LKFEVIIDGREAMLEVLLDARGNRFRYQRKDGETIEREFSAVATAPGSHSVLIGARSYKIVAESVGKVLVNSCAFDVDVFDPREMRGRKGSGAGEGRQNIKALMPGKVVRVLVAQGDVVEAGQGLVVVEAMKMQNEMKSPKAGRVCEVKTRADATVAAGEVLLVIE
jgi:biotin carboxyl carrier protein